MEYSLTTIFYKALGLDTDEQLEITFKTPEEMDWVFNRITELREKYIDGGEFEANRINILRGSTLKIILNKIDLQILKCEIKKKGAFPDGQAKA